MVGVRREKEDIRQVLFVKLYLSVFKQLLFLLNSRKESWMEMGWGALRVEAS